MDRIADPLVMRFADEYLPRLRALYDPTLVLVFGSRPRGDALTDSDLDMIVVSQRFRDVPFVDRIVGVLNELDLNLRLELLCYTPEEFERKRQELGIVNQAIAEGIALVGSSDAQTAAKTQSGGSSI